MRLDELVQKLGLQKPEKNAPGHVTGVTSSESSNSTECVWGAASVVNCHVPALLESSAPLRERA